MRLPLVLAAVALKGLDSAADAAREQVVVADGEREHVAREGFDGLDELAGVEVPDVDVALGAAGVEQGVVQGEGQDGVVAVLEAGQLADAGLVAAGGLLVVQLPQFDRAVAAARHERLLAGVLGVEPSSQQHTVHVSIVRVLHDAVLVNLQQLPAARQRLVVVRRARGGDAAGPLGVEEAEIALRGVREEVRPRAGILAREIEALHVVMS